MGKISDYKIVKSNSNEPCNDVEKVVNSLVKEGWQPYGALVISGSTVAQIMVRRWGND